VISSAGGSIVFFVLPSMGDHRRRAESADAAPSRARYSRIGDRSMSPFHSRRSDPIGSPGHGRSDYARLQMIRFAPDTRYRGEACRARRRHGVGRHLMLPHYRRCPAVERIVHEVLDRGEHRDDISVLSEGGCARGWTRGVPPESVRYICSTVAGTMRQFWHASSVALAH